MRVQLTTTEANNKHNATSSNNEKHTKLKSKRNTTEKNRKARINRASQHRQAFESRQLIQIEEEVQKLSAPLADVIKKIYGFEDESPHGYKDIAIELGFGATVGAVKAVAWIHDCAMEQIKSFTHPRCTPKEKEIIIKSLGELTLTEQQVLHHRYGLGEGLPKTFAQMACLFYENLSGRKHTAIQKHTAKALNRLAQKTKKSLTELDLILMSLSGNLPKADFLTLLQDTQLRRNGPTKLAALRDGISYLYNEEEFERFFITLTPNMREVLILILDNPEDTASDLARRLQEPDQSFKNAKTILDTQLSAIQKRLDDWSTLDFNGEDLPQNKYSDDIIFDIRELLQELSPEQLQSISQKLTKYQQDIFDLFISILKSAPSEKPENTSKHISKENQLLYEQIIKLMYSKAKEINPTDILKRLRDRISRILNDNSVKSCQPSPQLEALRARLEGNNHLLDKLEPLDAEIIKLRLGSKDIKPLTNKEIAVCLSHAKNQTIPTTFVERRVAGVYATLEIPSERTYTIQDVPVLSDKLKKLHKHIQANPKFLDELSELDRQIIDLRLNQDGIPRMTNKQVAAKLAELDNSVDISLIERRLTYIYKKLGI